MTNINVLQDVVLLHMHGSTLMETTRRIIRRLMTKTMACQFSLTGMGEKRTRTKLSFKEHVVSKHVIG
jgi:hypothetical protein